MAKVTFKNNHADMIKEYVKNQEEIKRLTKRNNELKASLGVLFTELAAMVKTNGTTKFFVGSIQKQGKAEYIAFKETHADGGIDYKAACEAMGATPEFLEQFRKADVVKTTIEAVNDKKVAEYEKLSNA